MFFLSFSALAETIVTGEEAKNLFENLQGYEYSAGAVTAGIQYKLTVRHNSDISCEKEETIMGNESQLQYTCTIKYSGDLRKHDPLVFCF